MWIKSLLENLVSVLSEIAEKHQKEIVGRFTLEPKMALKNLRLNYLKKSDFWNHNPTRDL